MAAIKGPFMKNKKIVILGGGFIGQNLALTFAEKNYEVTLFCRNIPDNRQIEKSSQIKVQIGDFFNKYDLKKALDKKSIVFHCISTTNPRTSLCDKVYDIKSNILGSAELLELMVKSNVKHMVFCSTGGAMYGNQVNADEKSFPEPCSPYAIGKLSIEHYNQLYQRVHGINYLNLRVANPYGPYQNAAKSLGVITAFLVNGIKGKPVKLLGNMKAERDYLYIQDLTDIIYRLIDNNIWNHTINIGTGQSSSLESILSMVSKVIGKPLEMDKRDSIDGEISSSSLNISLLQKLIGPIQFTSLEKGIEKYYQFLTKSGV